MAKLRELLSRRDSLPEIENEETLEKTVLQEDQHEELEMDISILEDEDGTRGQRLQKVAEKEVQRNAEDSLKRLHVIHMGRCPSCGEHIRQHLFASICESCGWHRYDVPRSGPVKVHLRDGSGTVEGERCYMIKSGAALVVRDDLVTARVPRDSLSWIEYNWEDVEIDQRHKQVVDRMTVSCGWCNGPTDPEKDGFHLVHVAFGASQERYCFCADDCYEAFCKMYPARVHRNCYDRSCTDCNLCIKRYGDENEGIRMIAKDRLQVGRKRKA